MGELGELKPETFGQSPAEIVQETAATLWGDIMTRPPGESERLLFHKLGVTPIQELIARQSANR